MYAAEDFPIIFLIFVFCFFFFSRIPTIKSWRQEQWCQQGWTYSKIRHNSKESVCKDNGISIEYVSLPNVPLVPVKMPHLSNALIFFLAVALCEISNRAHIYFVEFRCVFCFSFFLFVIFNFCCFMLVPQNILCYTVLHQTHFKDSTLRHSIERYYKFTDQIAWHCMATSASNENTARPLFLRAIFTRRLSLCAEWHRENIRSNAPLAFYMTLTLLSANNGAEQSMCHFDGELDGHRLVEFL